MFIFLGGPIIPIHPAWGHMLVSFDQPCLAGNDSSIVDHIISAVRKKPSTRLWVCTPQFFEIDKLKSSSSMAASRRNTRKRVRPESKLYPIEYRKEIKRFTQRFPNLTSLGCGSGLLTSFFRAGGKRKYILCLPYFHFKGQ